MITRDEEIVLLKAKWADAWNKAHVGFTGTQKVGAIQTEVLKGVRDSDLGFTSLAKGALAAAEGKVAGKFGEAAVLEVLYRLGVLFAQAEEEYGFSLGKGDEEEEIHG